MDIKLDVLNNPEKYKGIDNRGTILAPMVYWNGDTDDPMVVPECDEIFVHEKREKIKPLRLNNVKIRLGWSVLWNGLSNISNNYKSL